ncbi:MAG TPA: TPM domain-containing protein, partial [Tepidisphaeraceae bacterium]|nr:TPM domain-containing protein [Tepidisphaeraceae bacterium]
MPRVLRFIVPVLTLLTLGVCALPAAEIPRGVRDEAHFFSADAITAADAIINQIWTTHKKDVLVVTYAAIPADQQDEFKALGKEAFYEDWARKIWKENHANGVVVLATGNPAYLQVNVGDETRKRAFTLGDRDRLRADLLSAFKQKNFDAGLLDGLRSIQSRMNQNLRGNGASAGAAAPGAGARSTGTGTGSSTGTGPGSPNRTINSPTGGGFPIWGWMCAGIGILVIVFLAISAMNRRRMYGGPGSGGGPGYPPQAGGYPQGGYP